MVSDLAMRLVSDRGFSASGLLCSLAVALTVTGTSHLKPNYVKKRLEVATDGALNVDRLLTAVDAVAAGA